MARKKKKESNNLNSGNMMLMFKFSTVLRKPFVKNIKLCVKNLIFNKNSMSLKGRMREIPNSNAGVKPKALRILSSKRIKPWRRSMRVHANLVAVQSDKKDVLVTAMPTTRSSLTLGVQHTSSPSRTKLKAKSKLKVVIKPERVNRSSLIKGAKQVVSMSVMSLVKNEPRELKHCKSRPKDNKTKGGGGLKRFVPWCS